MKEDLLDNAHVHLNTLLQLVVFIRIFEIVLVVEAPFVLVVLQALQQYFRCVSSPFFHHTLQGGYLILN